MHIEQIYTNCLSEASYFIHDGKDAVVIDPIREPHQYLDKAKATNTTIRYIFETHFHADFVSGHLELANITGAQVVFGPGAETDFSCIIARDNEEFTMGDCVFKILHTPGHTPESACFLLFDKTGLPKALFSGDTLFIGDVGRPDLAVSNAYSQKELAGMLYDSLHQKIMSLPDEVVVYPAHGPGSACGKNISKDTFDSLGNQKLTNPALQNISKDVFIKNITDGILDAPNYFAINADMNRRDYLPFQQIVDHGLQTLTDEQITNVPGAILLDTRTADVFEKGHIPGSINIGLNGQFAIWAGTLLSYNKAIILIAEKGKEKEAAIRLTRVGFEKIAGYLDGGFENWKVEGRQINQISSIYSTEIQEKLAQGWKILDVRKPSEFNNGHLAGAININLQQLEENIDNLNKNTNYIVYCGGGYRSMIAISILNKNGLHRFVNVYKGYNGIKQEPALQLAGAALAE